MTLTRAARLRAGLRQIDVARAAGIDRTDLSSVETLAVIASPSGHGGRPGPHLRRFAAAYARRSRLRGDGKLDSDRFAGRLTMAGQNERTLVELLCHNDPKMTTRYQHLSPEHLKRAVECLDEQAV